jgi:hypothetical protein
MNIESKNIDIYAAGTKEFVLTYTPHQIGPFEINIFLNGGKIFIY